MIKKNINTIKKSMRDKKRYILLDKKIDFGVLSKELLNLYGIKGFSKIVFRLDNNIIQTTLNSLKDIMFCLNYINIKQIEKINVIKISGTIKDMKK